MRRRALENRRQNGNKKSAAAGNRKDKTKARTDGILGIFYKKVGIHLLVRRDEVEIRKIQAANPPKTCCDKN